MIHERCLNAVKKTIKDYDLPMKVIVKDESWLMRTANVVVRIFNPRFMQDYATAIPFLGRVYIPSSWYADDYWRVLAHEGVHLQQGKIEGQLAFSLKYMFPQVLSLLALGAIGAIWFFPMLLCLLFLLFLAPLPAPWRVKYEREAYLVTAAIDKIHSKFDITSNLYYDYMVEHHTGWAYYKPSWNAAAVKEKIVVDMVKAERLVDGDHSGSYVADVIQAIKTEEEAQ